jgi:hypothetical protein
LLLQLLEGANVEGSGSKTQAEGLMYARISDLAIFQKEKSCAGEEEKDLVCSLQLITTRHRCVPAKIRSATDNGRISESFN